MSSRDCRARAKPVLAALLISVALGLAPRILSAQTLPPPEESRLSPRLLDVVEGAGAGPEEVVPVVVTTAQTPTDSDISVLKEAGGSLHRRFGKLSSYAATISVGALRKLAKTRGVIAVSYDAEVSSDNDLNYVTVGADLAAHTPMHGWAGLDGSGVTVAVVDSGIAFHADLDGRILAEAEIVGHEKGFDDPYGHGTHVAGIIAGDGSASSGPGAFRRFNGIAPNANLVSVRVLNGKGSGRVSDLLAGIDWVLANKNIYNIRIMNLSLGRTVEEPASVDPLCRAVEAAWHAGILVVAAAGNSGAAGYGSIHSPGNDPTILTVGASNNYRTASRYDDLLTSYTSRGPTALDHVVKPDLVAPGNRTISLRAEGSTLDKLYPSLRVAKGVFIDDPTVAGDDSAYFTMSGSSMAAGVVSGMAALMIQADPSLTPDTLKARLMKSAEKRMVDDVFSEGAGFADLQAALAEQEIASGPSLSPAVQWTASGLEMQDTGALWGSGSSWSLSLIFGADPLRGTSAVWASTSLWTDSGSQGGSTTGDSIVWGGGKKSSAGSDSIVWGGGIKGSVGSDSIVWGGGMKSPDSSTVGADSIVWGGGHKATDTTISGDAVP
jgi:serine protease AprX